MMINTNSPQFGHVLIKDPDKKVNREAIFNDAKEAAAQQVIDSLLGNKILEEGRQGTYAGYLFETAKPEYDAYFINAAQKAGANAEILQDDQLKKLRDAKMPWKDVLAHPFKVLAMDIPEKGAFISPGVVKLLLIAGWPNMIWAKITGKL